jgi:hypothetical protein
VAEPEPLLDEVAAAAFLHVTRRCLQGWRFARRGGPAYVKFGSGRRGLIRYRPEDLKAFIAARLVGNPQTPHLCVATAPAAPVVPAKGSRRRRASGERV